MKPTPKTFPGPPGKAPKPKFSKQSATPKTNEEAARKEDAYARRKEKSLSKPGAVKKQTSGKTQSPAEEKMPLNKFIAHCGICSRRDAVELIREGRITLNGKVEQEPGTRVTEVDRIELDGKVLTPQKQLVYYLINKPKDYITTTDDPEGRKTVLDLLPQAKEERVYPVGRLDRNTTGLLLLTNDGDLAQKLSHPSNKIKKVYHVVLDKPVIKKDFDRIVEGVMLEDGPAYVDELAYVEADNKTELGLEIHSGRNRIVRRIFEHLGYQVKQLDRVMYAGLTKKNLPRGKWRTLSPKEIIFLKHFRK